ncbi:hypothetical protein KSS87_007143 [Heliosperma pusillum]|nr:hypothetical protein KSS87_007143 [Heliosperma pusillum]
MNRKQSWMKYTVRGLDHVTVDACVNHCVIFREEFANEDKCPQCLATRWKETIVQGGDECSDDDNVCKKALDLGNPPAIIDDSGELQRDTKGTLLGLCEDVIKPFQYVMLK